MKRKSTMIIIALVFLIGIMIGVTISLNQHLPNEIDENMLSLKEFKDVILRFERYDYALGQKMLVGVEKSMDQGKTYTRVTKEPIAVSSEARFFFMNESSIYVISTPSITRNNNFIGFLVSQDGGATFENAKFTYDNPRVDWITIEDFPYYENNVLKLKTSVYDINSQGNGYEDIEVIFISNDEGFTWDEVK